jgi:hypothetical protein
MARLIKYAAMCRAVDAAYEVDEVLNVRGAAVGLERCRPPIAGRLNQAILGDIKRGMGESEDPALIHAMIALADFEQTCWRGCRRSPTA